MSGPKCQPASQYAIGGAQELLDLIGTPSLRLVSFNEPKTPLAEVPFYMKQASANFSGGFKFLLNGLGRE